MSRISRPIFALGLILGLSLLGSALFCFTAAYAQGTASIYLGPSTGTFTVGSTFSVSIYVNTGGQSVNAIETVLQFPPDKLQVVAPTAGKSLIQVWITQPTYSNVEGKLRFQGAIPSPGISTDAGLISTVTFRVKDTGTATIRVLGENSRVLLNDGRGTDILSQTTSGVYQLRLPPPAGPVVASRTNPDQEKWYATENVTFDWEAQPDTQGFSYVLNDSPVDDPDDISEGLKANARYGSVANGVHYFHLKALRNGVWGGVTDYEVKVDNKPPAAFEISISPSSYTSNQRPIIEFQTTDETSGVNHYEFKIISLNLQGEGTGNETPFFIEASSPYATKLDMGRYDVVVRAYDEAGNYTQASERLTITHALFEFVGEKGVRIRGDYTLSWPLAGVIALILLTFLAVPALAARRWHRRLEGQLAAGGMAHPSLKERLGFLSEKSRERDGDGPSGTIRAGALVLALLCGLGMLFVSTNAAAQMAGDGIEPPVVTLFPQSISNDEIFYIGGRANAPEADVILYLQNVETGSTVSQTIKTDATGSWFITLPSFLDSGQYVAWTQLRVNEEMSPPSSRIELMVAPTAIQLAKYRLSYQSLYLILFLIFLGAFLALMGFTVYHAYHGRTKQHKLRKEIADAEESIRRGFLVLRRDIEAELSIIRKVKLGKELSLEEKMREEKLLRDVELVRNYIGREVWEVEKAEREL